MINLLLNTGLYTTVAVLVVFFIIIGVIIGILPVNIWIRAFVSGAYVSPGRLIGMKLRHVNVNKIIDNYINAVKAGIEVNIEDLETHELAGGEVEKVVSALIMAHGAGILLDVQTAKAIDLADRDIVTAVRNSVKPYIIQTPEIKAVAKDGIELIVVAKVTVKDNIAKLIGGAGNDTIIARVGEGIVTAVGSAESHKDILQSPDRISKLLLEKNLDLNTAFNIVSIDIASISVGENIDAKLRAKKAASDVEIAKARAAERRSMAVAAEQEMRAKTQEMRAKLLSAESEVPKAISNAFMQGHIGVLDYYKMQNILADTSMRSALGAAESNTKKDSKKGDSKK